jgi:hypothetical protein
MNPFFCPPDRTPDTSTDCPADKGLAIKSRELIASANRYLSCKTPYVDFLQTEESEESPIFTADKPRRK